MVRKHKPSTALFKVVSPACHEEKNLSVVEFGEQKSPSKGSDMPQTVTHALGCTCSIQDLVMVPGTPADSRGGEQLVKCDS